MKRLIILPCEPTNTNGYGIAVQCDLEKLSITQNDTVIFYQRDINFQDKKPSYSYILGKSWLSISGVFNLLRLRIPTELSYKSISKICTEDFDYIFIGDSILYRAVRKIYPKNKIHIRLHNIYHRSLEIRKNNFARIGVSYKLKEFIMMRLENIIFRDVNSKFITISEEDNSWLNRNNIPHSEVWPVTEKISPHRNINNNIYVHNKNIVWFGSVASHNKIGLEWFLHEVLPKLRKLDSDIVLHMFGQGTEKYNNPKLGQIGHGFHKQTTPPLNGNGIFINPDLIGLGVKMKLGYLIKENLFTITTPEGAVGYDIKNLNNIITSKCENWVKDIHDLIIRNGSTFPPKNQKI